MKKFILFLFLMILGTLHGKVAYIYKVNNNFGLLDKKGHIITAPVYKHIDYLKKGLIPVLKKDYFLFLKEDGSKIDKNFWDIKDPVSVENFGVFIPVADYKSKKWGIIDGSGNYFIPPVYDTIHFYDNNTFLGITKKVVNYLNLKGNVFLTLKNLSFSTGFVNGYAFVKKKEHCGFIDVKGNGSVSISCERVLSRKNNIAAVKNHDKVVIYGINKGKLFEIKSDTNLFIYNNGIAQHKLQNDKYLVIDTIKERFTIVPKKNCSIKICKENLCCTDKYGEVRVFNWSGQVLRKFLNKKASITIDQNNVKPLNNYDEVTYSGVNNVFFVRKGDKYGMVNRSGKDIIKPQYDMIRTKDPFGLGDYLPFQIKAGKKYGFVDKNGKNIVSPIYDYICEYNSGVAKVIKNNRAFIINSNGKIVFEIPNKYISKENCSGMECVNVRSVRYQRDSCDGGVSGGTHGGWLRRYYLMKK